MDVVNAAFVVLKNFGRIEPPTGDPARIHANTDSFVAMLDEVFYHVGVAIKALEIVVMDDHLDVIFLGEFLERIENFEIVRLNDDEFHPEELGAVEKLPIFFLLERSGSNAERVGHNPMLIEQFL